MKKTVVSIFIFFLFIGVEAQVTTSISEPQMNVATPEQMKAPIFNFHLDHLEQLLFEDSIEAADKSIPWRFGYAFDSLINVIESASRLSDQSMTHLQMEIQSKGAKSINLSFSDFYLPEGALLFIKSKYDKDVLGALTSANNKENGLFSTRPIKGSAILIDLYVPNDELEAVKLKIDKVIHAYRDVFNKVSKTFGSSGNCNRNINCPEAAIWQDVKRSVVLITASNGNRLCTGTLINNVRQDSIPYLLTASHCGIPTNAVFIFNYENSSSSCTTDADGSLTNSISGAFDRAESSLSDFHLMELSTSPPASYNAYYAGWNSRDQAPHESTIIHHPSGDIKKISIDEDTARSSHTPPQVDNQWQVGNWESATTERGSSGGALFDQNKRIVGQLDGGTATCAQDLSDWFGKFSTSWDFLVDTNRQLKFWLDPDNTNTPFMDGLDPLPKAFQTDVELSYIANVREFNCDSFLNPIIHAMNVGNDTIQNLTVQYGTNNNYTQSFNWTGSITTDRIAEISLPALAINAGDSIFVARLVSTPTDQNTSNNGLGKDIRVNDRPLQTGLRFKTDQFGEELTWFIRDSTTREIIHRDGPYIQALSTAGINYYDSLCLYGGCFEFVLHDNFGDGFTGISGNGKVLLQATNGDTLVLINNFTTDSIKVSFCLQDTSVGLEEIQAKSKLKLYPNPVERGRSLFLEYENGDRELSLIDMKGQIVLRSRGRSIQIPFKIAPSIYIIEIKASDNSIERRKIIVR